MHQSLLHFKDRHYTDIGTGEVQLMHLYYDANTGHFLNRDPIE